jgi:hypothetical protein
MRSRAVWLVIVVMLGASPALAQMTQGRLTGTVTDAQGAVMPGVTVTVTSPAMIGSQNTVTEANGRYLFPSLPSGTYKVAFELSGFQKVNRENIAVVTGQTISADVQLQVASLAESVTVTGASPVVDVTTTKVGTNLKGEELTAVPNSTDAWGALSEAPGIRMQGFDVGGSHKSQQSGYEVFGIQNQSRIVTDGVDHTEGAAGGTGYYEDYYSNEEVSISALGSDVEMNSGGAAVVTTVKSGGNQFKGLENFTYESGSWVGDNNSDALRARGFTGNPNLLFYEGHADLGGPIKRDKAWFFVAYNTFKIDKVVSGVPQNIATDIGLFHNYTGKGTWKPSGSDTVIGYIQRGRKQKPKRSLSTLIPPESVLAQNSLTYTYKGEWQRVLSNRVFLDATVGNYHSLWPMVPQVDPATRVPTTNRATGVLSGAGWNAFTSVRNNPQAKAQLTYYLPDKRGSHDFKFGFEFRHDYYQLGTNGNSGPYRLSFNAAGVADRIRFVDVGTNADYGTGWTVAPNIDQRYSGYAQDRWAPNNRLTITAGVRMDHQNVQYGDSIRKPLISDLLPDGTRIFPASSNVSGASQLVKTTYAPRLGFSYDLTGKSKTVLKGFYGRYYNNIADSFYNANPGGTSYAEYNFNDLNRNNRYDGPSELAGLRLRIGGADAPVDANARVPFTEEFSGSVEHQFWGESSARLTYVRKHTGDFMPFFYNPYVPAWDGKLTVPTRQVSSDGQVFNLVDIPSSLASQSSGLYTNIPDGNFYYDTIEVAFNKRFSQKFFVQTSADYQKRNELRSADIPDWGSTSPLSTDPIGVGYFVNANPSVSNRQKTTMYHFQMMGRYTFPGEVGFAVNYRYQSGFQYSEIIADGDTSPGLNITPSPFFVQNLDQNRSDNVSLLNFRLDKGFTFGGHYKLTGIFDLYNVLNANPVTNFSLTNGNFGTVIAALDPRVAQLAIRFEF